MPKRPHRDKQGPRPGRPTTARDLITARLPTLAQRALSAPETSEWHVAVMRALGPTLGNKVNRCSLEAGTVTVVAESAAWAARMRFALADTAGIASVTPGFKAVRVSVRPRRGPGTKS